MKITRISDYSHKTHTFPIPNTINNFFEDQKPSYIDFKTLWQKLKEESSSKLFTSDKIAINDKIIKKKSDFLQFLPIFIEKNKENGCFFAHILLNEIAQEFLLKMKFYEKERKVFFNVLAKKSTKKNDSIERFILENLIFLICINL